MCYNWYFFFLEYRVMRTATNVILSLCYLSRWTFMSVFLFVYTRRWPFCFNLVYWSKCYSHIMMTEGQLIRCSSASAMKNTPLKLSYVYQCTGCDSFHLQPIGRTVSKVCFLIYHAIDASYLLLTCTWLTPFRLLHSWVII